MLIYVWMFVPFLEAPIQGAMQAEEGRGKVVVDLSRASDRTTLIPWWYNRCLLTDDGKYASLV